MKTRVNERVSWQQESTISFPCLVTSNPVFNTFSWPLESRITSSRGLHEGQDELWQAHDPGHNQKFVLLLLVCSCYYFGVRCIVIAFLIYCSLKKGIESFKEVEKSSYPTRDSQTHWPAPMQLDRSVLTTLPCKSVLNIDQPMTVPEVLEHSIATPCTCLPSIAKSQMFRRLRLPIREWLSRNESSSSWLGIFWPSTRDLPLSSTS